MTDASETIRALQDALRLSEERTELALDAANAGVFDADITAGVVYGSARYRELLGVPDGPIDARATVDIAHPDDRALALAPWRAGEVNGRVCYLIRAKPPGAADWRTYETRARLIRDDAGRVIRIIGVSYDVTDSVARLQALRESEQRLSAAQAIAGIGTWSYEIRSSEIIWTPEVFRMYDVDQQGRTGPAFSEFLAKTDKADRAILLECIRRASEDGTSYVVNSTIHHRDGSVRRLRCNGGAVRDESGAIVRLAGIAEDITESWLLEQRLRQSEERYELALEGTSDGIFQFDWRTRQIEVSPRLLDLVGRPHDNRWVTVDWVSTVVVESDLPLLRTALDLHVRERVPLDLELRLITLDRGIRWFRVRGRAVRDEHGAALRLAGAVSDVTEQRAMHARLQHTSKMTALGTLAGGIAHDFNNLVAAMLGYAELAADEMPRGSAAGAHVQQVIEAAQRARDLVREILAFSRPEDQRRSAVDMSQLAVETQRLVRATMPASVSLRVEGHEHAHLVLGDPIQLQRVLLNLCTNSIDAVRRRYIADHILPASSVDGAGAVVVRIGDEGSADTIKSQGLPSGRYVRVQVSDDGVGITPDVLARVFEPFFTTKPVGEGTGLGLSIVHSIVVASGGAVHVDSVEHVGTTVTCWLPLLEGAAPVAQVDAPETAVTEPSQRARIVVIDDDPAVGRLLQVALQRSNYRVTLFTSPATALEAFSEHPNCCDCIVTDFAMPELNGIDLLARLRADGVDAPAILVTGFADGASYEARERVGIVTTLQKPIELRRFIHAVETALAATALRHPATT